MNTFLAAFGEKEKRKREREGRGEEKGRGRGGGGETVSGPRGAVLRYSKNVDEMGDARAVPTGAQRSEWEHTAACHLDDL